MMVKKLESHLQINIEQRLARDFLLLSFPASRHEEKGKGD